MARLEYVCYRGYGVKEYERYLDKLLLTSAALAELRDELASAGKCGAGRNTQDIRQLVDIGCYNLNLEKLRTQKSRAGKASRASLTPEARSAAAKRAAEVRWGK